MGNQNVEHRPQTERVIASRGSRRADNPYRILAGPGCSRDYLSAETVFIV